MRSASSGVSAIVSPPGSMKKLEANLKFSDTFKNRIALADCCLAKGQTIRAIDLYESSLTGTFAENEYAISQLIIAYYQEKRYSDIISIAKKIYKHPQFPRSKAHIFYAMSLGYTGNNELAEKEFLMMQGRYSNFECRYYYSLFLQLNNRTDEAKQVLQNIKDEIPQLSAVEKRYHREWINLAKESLRKIS